jgi:hypothetical protein
MDYKRVESSLKILHKSYKSILDDTHEYVLPEAIEGIKVTKDRYDTDKARGRPAEPWGYSIEHNQPLRFKPSVTRQLGLQVDVYCRVLWEDNDTPVRQDIKVRIWTDHNDITFVPDRDAVAIGDQLMDPERHYPGRVVSRFHFDKAALSPGAKSEYHPEYHMQVGGKPEDYELCWHPKKVNIPRLMYQPMELFLTCQTIAASFFQDEYLEIRRKSEWRNTLLWYQRLLLRDYYAKCLSLIDENKSLLDGLEMS